MDVKSDPGETLRHNGQAHPPELRWTVHPLRDEPGGKSGLLIAIVLGLSAAVAASFNSGRYGFLTLALLLASLSRYFLPTRYALDATGARISHLGSRRTLPWTQVRRNAVCPEGVFLSPFPRARRLDPFRGCFLRFNGNREEVVRFVQTHVANRSL